MKEKRSIIIDTDPGIDDAVAIGIALFSEKLDVKLITTVAGNVGIDIVTNNALKLLRFFGKDVPVAKGCAAALIEPREDASQVHGASGMDGYDFEPPKTELLLKEHAVNAMYRTIMENSEKTTLVPIGPLTNIAILLKLYPEVKEKIDEIVLMGGTLNRGNKGVMSEFNIALDPEAAKIVFSSKLKIVMAGLDVGLKALILPEVSEKVKTLNKTGDMFYALFKKYRGGSFQTGLKMYDSCAIAYLLKPEMYKLTETFVGIELNGSMTRGATLVDLRNYLKEEPNATVCEDIDAEMFKSWFIESVSSCI